MEKIELNLTRFEDLNGKRQIGLQYIKVKKQLAMLEDYKKQLEEGLKPIVEEEPNGELVTPAGTIKYYKGGIVRTLDKKGLEKDIGTALIEKHTKTSEKADYLKVECKRVEN